MYLHPRISIFPSINFDVTDHYMGGKYIDEVKQLLLKLLKEYNTIVNSTVDVKDLNENQIVNTPNY